MKQLVLCIALSACTYSAGGMGPAAQPAPDPMLAQAAEARANQQHTAIRVIAQTYDEVLVGNDEADQLAQSKRYEDAMRRYRKVELRARQMLAWFANDSNQLGRGPKVRYRTEHDGKLDEGTLIGNLERARDRARQEASAVADKAAEQLAAELHAKTPGQRAVLLQHGRPEVTKTKRETCWTYRTPVADETFCWKKGGKLAKHDVQPKVQVARKQPARPAKGGRSQPVVAAAPPAEEPEPTAWQPVAAPAEDTSSSTPTSDTGSGSADNPKPEVDTSYCSSISDSDLMNLCRAAADPGYCSSINNPDLMNMCRASTDPGYCSSINDADLMNLCRSSSDPGYCSSINNADLMNMCRAAKDPGYCSSINDADLMNACRGATDPSYCSSINNANAQSACRSRGVGSRTAAAGAAWWRQHH